MKHAHYTSVGLDFEGSDTWRRGKAGAGMVVLSSDDETVIMLKRNVELADIEYSIGKLVPVDLILVEGFKGDDIHKIAVGDIEEENNTVFRYKGNIGKSLNSSKRSVSGGSAQGDVDYALDQCGRYVQQFPGERINRVAPILQIQWH